MPIRVLQIIPTLVRGGAEKQMSLLACHLPRDQFDVHVAVLTHDGPYRELLERHGVPVTVIGKRWKIDAAAYWRLKRFIQELKPDLVHTWIFAANSYGRAAAIRAGVPHVVAGERCVDPWKDWHEFAIDRWLARRTSRLVTNSSGVRDFYVAHGISADQFELIPNAIEPSQLKPKPREEFLNELQLPPDVKLIGAVGRLWPQKRYQDLIWAAELLKAGRGDTHFVIVGDGPQREDLESYARDVHVDDHVHFLGDRPDVAQILPSLDCFWLGSGYEGQSNSLMEAMLAGLPVVVTDISGNRDLVEHEQQGFLVSVGDAGQFARRTHFLLDNPEIARAMGERGRKRMQDDFTVAKMVSRHVELYRQIVGR